jgi:hypothetical protein
MAVFSISCAAIRGELGDFSYPNGRIHGDFDGEDGVSMHVRFERRACEVYGARRAPIGLRAAADEADARGAASVGVVTSLWYQNATETVARGV